MIAGLNSSSIYLAMRTADRANRAMDKAANQIASGKKIASVKDDGAAYVRAAAAKSQLAQIEGRRAVLSAFDTVVKNQTAQDEASNAATNWMADIVFRALDFAAGSIQRQQLNSEFQQAFAQWSNSRTQAGMITSGTGSLPTGGWGVKGTNQDEITAVTMAWSIVGTSWFDNGHASIDYLGNGVPINGIDVLNGNSTNLKNGLATLKQHLNVANAHTLYGGDAKWLDRASDISDKQEDRLNASIASLTDADLGVVERDYQIAQTRQSLANETVRNAISAYSSKATSLLNNVMGTQRSVKA